MQSIFKSNINERYQSIQDTRRKARGEVVGLILARDKSIEVGVNDKEVTAITHARKLMDDLLRDIIKKTGLTKE